MQPMIILPPEMMSEQNILALRDNGICVVEAKDPSKIKFLDPIPAVSSRTGIENAAIQLSRCVLNGIGRCTIENGKMDRVSIMRQYIDLLVIGTPLDPKPPREETERTTFDEERENEIRKIAREEARAERKEKKEAEAKRLAEAKKSTTNKPAT